MKKSAAILCTAALAMPIATGCDAINQMVDAETARVEGRTVPLQLGAAMAFGVMQTSNYVQQFQGLNLTNIDDLQSCANVAVEGSEMGSRDMVVDFGPCDALALSL